MTATFNRPLTRMGGNRSVDIPLATFSAIKQLAKLHKVSHSAAVFEAVDGALKDYAKGRGYVHIPKPFQADYAIQLFDELTFSLYHPELPDTVLRTGELRTLANHLIGPETSRPGDLHHTIIFDGRHLQVRRRGRTVHLMIGEGNTSMSVPEAKAVGQGFLDLIADAAQNHKS